METFADTKMYTAEQLLHVIHSWHREFCSLFWQKKCINEIDYGILQRATFQLPVID